MRVAAQPPAASADVAPARLTDARMAAAKGAVAGVDSAIDDRARREAERRQIARDTQADGNPNKIIGVRVWPAQAYTRVTIELDRSLSYSHFVVDGPDRVVVDLQGLVLDKPLKDLVDKITPNDPNIASVRVGQFNPQTLRMVFDTRQAMRPQVFVLDPVGQYRHRLVIDLYPGNGPTPGEQLAMQTEWAKARRQSRATTPDEERNLPSVGADDAGGHDRAGRAGTRTRRGAPRPAIPRLVTIAIDAGHGGEDPGAIGARGSFEKNITLAIAQRLAEHISGEPNMRAFLTRDGDYFVPLGDRVNRARAVKADLFVSVHADAVRSPDAEGSSVFVMSGDAASSVEARWLARRENGADQVGGLNLATRNEAAAHLLMQMYTEGQIRDSRRLASSVLGELGGLGKLHKAQVEQAAFAVLKAPDIPSILVETAFISNPDDERRLNSPVHQDRIALALLDGIRRYFDSHPPRPSGPVM